MDRKTYRVLAKNLPLVTQFGLSLVMPPVLCAFGANWLQRRFGFGSWIMLVAIVLGLLGMLSAFLSFFRYMAKQAEEEEREYREGG